MVKRFAAEATANPTRYYRAPREVVQDRRLTKDEKLAILRAWDREARAMAEEANDTAGEASFSELVEEIRLACAELDGEPLL